MRLSIVTTISGPDRMSFNRTLWVIKDLHEATAEGANRRGRAYSATDRQSKMINGQWKSDTSPLFLSLLTDFLESHQALST